MLGAQASLTASLRGAPPSPFGSAARGALIQTLPWIPVTLAVIALTVRFPVTGTRRWRHAAVHAAFAPVLAFVANVLVVLGYWITSGNYAGVGDLVTQGARWATVNFHVALVVYAAILLLTQAVLYYRRARDSELRLARVEGQLARAQVQALNAQLRPHFLFNALHTIGQMWRSGRADEADALLDTMGALFQKVQGVTSRTGIPLSEELAMVREYLTIEQARFRDRMRVTIDATADSARCVVPPLLLQPLVENAVRHGISAASSAGDLRVVARAANGRLRLTVSDDGPGPSAPAARPGAGTGLRNTRERLAQLYGDAASLEIAGGAGGGTVVTVDLPRTDQADDE